MNGFVYAIECGGRIKIGFSEKPEARFSKIASDAPFPCVMHGYWPGTVADELDVQTKFNDIRVHGEWFAVTETLLAFISDQVGPPVERQRKFSVRQGDSPLAVWRKKQALPMQHFADIIGTTKASWCRWESGKRTIPAAKLATLRSMTGLTIEELLPSIFKEVSA